jgi:hypothetical protein
MKKNKSDDKDEKKKSEKRKDANSGKIITTTG